MYRLKSALLYGFLLGQSRDYVQILGLRTLIHLDAGSEAKPKHRKNRTHKGALHKPRHHAGPHTPTVPARFRIVGYGAHDVAPIKWTRVIVKQLFHTLSETDNSGYCAGGSGYKNNEYSGQPCHAVG